VAERIAFMERGVVVEEGTAAQVLDAPRDPRTRAFLAKLTYDRPAAKAMSWYTIDLASVWSRREMLLSWLLVTAELWVLALALGLAGGLIVGLGGLSRRKGPGWPAG